jgi:hypothetical protein
MYIKIIVHVNIEALSVTCPSTVRVYRSTVYRVTGIEYQTIGSSKAMSLLPANASHVNQYMRLDSRQFPLNSIILQG